MKERRLIRPSNHSPNTYADVVGLIPSSAHQLLHENIDNRQKYIFTPRTSSNLSLPFFGRVDSNSSLGFLSLPGGKIHIWKNISCTLSEELQAATTCEELIYPNVTLNIQDNSNSLNDVVDERLIAVVSRGSGTNVPLFGLYACTSNGTLCSWNAVLLQSTNRRKVSKPPDGIVKVPLLEKDGEYVTLISPFQPRQTKAENYGGILICTNKSRIFFATKNTRQIHLQINLLDLTFTISAQSTSIIGVLGRMGRMLYSSDVASTPDVEQTGSIFALHYLPKIINEDVSMSSSKTENDDFASRKAFKSESPHRFLVIQSNLCVTLCSYAEPVTSEKFKLDYEEKAIGQESLGEQVQLSIWQEMKSLSPTAESNDLRLSLLATATSKQPFENYCVLILAIRATLGPSQHRLYLLQFNIDLCYKSAPSFIHLKSSCWLSRYSNNLSASIACCGLLITHPDNTFQTSEFSIYSMWQSIHTSSLPSTNENLPVVTVTALHCCASSSQVAPIPRIYDMELPTDVTPSILGIGTTPQTEGVLLMSQSGCIINTRIKIAKNLFTSTQSLGTSALSNAPDKTLEETATLQTLTNHLLSSFSTYSSNSKARSANDNERQHDFSSSIPPSLLHSSPHLLNTTVTDTSLHFILPKSELEIDDEAQSLMYGDMLKDMLEKHIDFCNFMNRSGIYKRLTEKSRNILADHGEIISSSLALFPVVENLITEEENDQVKRVYKSFLHEFSTRSIHLVKHLQHLHATLVPLSQNTVSVEENAHLLNISYLLYIVFSETRNYRAKWSDILYDLRDRGNRECDNVNMHMIPWTSKEETRALLEHHLTISTKFITNDFPKHIVNGEEMKMLALTLLGSFHVKENNLKPKSDIYHHAKTIAIPFLLNFSGEDVALEKSVEHFYFQGILEICDARQKKLLKKTKSILASNSQEQAKLSGDLTLIDLLCRERSDALFEAVDATTGLTFPQFVLDWYNRKKNYGKVLELGKYCPIELKEIFKHGKIQNHQWIDDVRIENWDAARSSLLGLVAHNERNRSDAPQRHSLQDQSLFLSLAKLASKIDSYQNQSMNGDMTGLKKNKGIENGLLLVRCQEMLNANHAASFDGNSEVPLSSQHLLEIARIQISNQTLSYDERVKAALIGLAISETLSSNNVTTSNFSNAAGGASKIWFETISGEMNTTWRSLQDQNDILTEEELKNSMSETLFFGVSRQYHLLKRSSSSALPKNIAPLSKIRDPEEQKENLSFGENLFVQTEVLSKIGDDESFDRLLKIAARLSITA